MNFYSLVEKESGNLIYDVVEFEDNGVVVIYCYEKKDVKTYDNIECLKDIVNKYSDYLALIKEGIEEEDWDVKDLLYSV